MGNPGFSFQPRRRDRRRRPGAQGAVLAAVALAVASSTGCRSSHRAATADKAGGSSAPIVLSLAASTSVDQPNARDVRYFAVQVGTLSGGSLRVRIVFEAAGRDAVFAEPQIARMVRDERFDLGWIAGRAWDELGVKTLQPLQTPFLVTTYPLLDRVLRSPLAGRMQQGLHAGGVVGLGLVPDLLQHPFGGGRSLLRLRDYSGTRMRVHPSRTTDALVRLLGARPVHVADAVTLVGAGKVDGLETEFPEESSTPFVVTGNVTLFPKVDTLFAGTRAFERLDRSERAALRAAARRTLEHMIATQRPEAALLRDFCVSGGRVALAGAPSVAQLERAAEPVTAALERDPANKRVIDAIRTLKRSMPTERPLVVPDSCAPVQALARSGSRRRPPALLNGTYRYTLTQASADAFGPPITGHNEYPVVVTVVLQDGKWSLRTDELDTGTYAIAGNRVAFRWPRVGYTNTFSLKRDKDGTLHLKPVLPMDRGDQFVWASEPWRRVGTPIRLTAP